jgi:Skp family chaperone for outer membrane proteins
MSKSIKVVDFQVLTKHYKTYQDGVDKIENKKKEIIEELNPYKVEINKLLKKERDDKTDMQIQTVSEKAFEIEKRYKEELKSMSEELNEKCYDELSDIISEWGEENDIDIIFGKMEVVYCKDRSDVTESIIEEVKKKDMYVS